MNIMGLDQSFTSTGVVILDTSHKVIQAKIITTVKDKEDPLTNFKRADDISNKISELCVSEGVHHVNIEGLGFGAVGDATRNLAGLQYLIVTKLISIGVTIDIIPPTALKKFATGSGKAKKEDMYESIQEKDSKFFEELSLVKKTKGRYDVADAYWLAMVGERHNEP